MKRTVLKLLFCVSLLMSCAGAIGAGIMLGTPLFVVFAVTAIIGSVWVSKLLKSVPNVGLIVKFRGESGYYQKGERKTTPVSNNDILYHIRMFLPFIQIGLFVFSVALFGSSHRSEYVSRQICSTTFNGGYAEVLFVEQGKQGRAYSELTIYDINMEQVESIFMRAESAIPSLDSIVGTDVYISYRRFPCSDSTLSYDKVMLDESFLDYGKLKFNYHFKNNK